MAGMGHHPLGGQKIRSGVLSEQGRQNWDAIFPPKEAGITEVVITTPEVEAVPYTSEADPQ